MQTHPFSFSGSQSSDLPYTGPVCASDILNCRNYVSQYETNAHYVPSSLLKTTSTTVISLKAFLWLIGASSTNRVVACFYLHINKAQRTTKRGGKSHQLYRDPYSRSPLMWQRAPHSSLDQSPPNRSPISRRDRAEGANISPWDPWLWWGKRRKARDKGEGRERDERGTEGKREREEWVSEKEKEREKNGRFFFRRGGRDPSGGRVLNPASLRCLLGSGGSGFSPSRSSGLLQVLTEKLWWYGSSTQAVKMCLYSSLLMPVCVFTALSSGRHGSTKSVGGAVCLNVFVGSENWSDVSPGVSVPAVLCLHWENHIQYLTDWSNVADQITFIVLGKKDDPWLPLFKKVGLAIIQNLKLNCTCMTF